jgi:hypothetical protein
LQEVIDKNMFMCMVMEYCAHGSVRHICDDAKAGLPEDMARRIFYQAGLGASG